MAEREQGSQPREPLRVTDLLLISTAQLVQKAWAFLGTISHPETGTQHRDLDQARLAIDAIERLLDLVRRASVPADALRDLEFQLANLRINYLALREKTPSPASSPDGSRE